MLCATGGPRDSVARWETAKAAFWKNQHGKAIYILQIGPSGHESAVHYTLAVITVLTDPLMKSLFIIVWLFVNALVTTITRGIAVYCYLSSSYHSNHKN